MRGRLYLGCSPAGEWCAQVGSDGYFEQARRECRAWVNQLRRVFGPEPSHAQLATTSNEHDFGPYLDVIVYFDSDDEAARSYAYRVEANQILVWDFDARRELKLPPET